jgi:uncharacterized small protein (DUF1192 family)
MDIVERLREPHWMPDADYMRSPESVSETVKLMRVERTEAAAIIESLQADVERLEAELAPLRKLRDAPEWETMRQALAAKGETPQ